MPSTPTITPAATRSHGLQRLIAPHDVEDFLETTLGEQMLHVTGPGDRWADLFSWQRLDEMLDLAVLPYPRMRLAKQGAEVPTTHYTFERNGARWPDATRCHQLMADGATMLVQQVERFTPSLALLVRTLERDLRANVRADLVATCASVPGLGMHWDNAECFNVQLDGEKDWTVVRPERPHPLTATNRFPERRDVAMSSAPVDAPAWTATVRPGDLIYLPRGWWHQVAPKTSPSLHLSISADLPTYTDYLLWLARESAHVEALRRNIPTWRSSEARLADADTTMREAQTPFSSDALASFLAHSSASWVSHQDFALPHAATSVPTFSPRTRVRLLSPHCVFALSTPDILTIDWHGKTIRFTASAMPIAHRLETMQPLTIEELCDGVDRMIGYAFLTSLMTVGLVGECV